MGGIAYVAGTIVAPGIVRQKSTYCRMMFGELDGRISSRGERLPDLCAASGIDGILSPDIRVALWEKFVGLMPLTGATALTRVPLGTFRADPDLWTMVEASAHETVWVGAAEGVPLRPTEPSGCWR
jgi:2-dehydropantoate 2-reductase